MPPATANGPRRRTIFGRTDRDVVLTMYAESWRQRIETNAAPGPIRDAKQSTYVDPLVTVSLRSDGTVEGVKFDRSSGSPEIDEAIRQMVMKLGPYGAFPPDLAREYDVIDIRRIWTFDVAVRLFSGGR